MMFEIEFTEEYQAWFAGLRDEKARARIDTRVQRLAMGNPGDVKPVGRGVSEIRIDYGPGYRVYFMRRKEFILILLAGGNKGSQAKDIRLAIELAEAERSKP
jgi:putative addiction module killer protein